MRHVELHNHTHNSILDGASTSEEYMKRAKELGMDSIAITDHGTTAGWREHQRQAKAYGIKPILGVEAYITPDRFDRRTAANREEGTGIYNHITLLAMNETGMRNIEHMGKAAWTEGFFHKPRIDIGLLEAHHEGIIALSGCMSGMIAKPWLNGDEATSIKYAQKLHEILGDRFYIEVMESNSYELNNMLIDLGKRYGIKPVVTSDCHMANQQDLALVEAMKILNLKSRKIDEPDYTRAAKMTMLEAINYLYPERALSFMEFELWLHSYEDHVVNLAAQDIGPEAVDNTCEIADRIGDYPYFENLDTLPKFPDADDEVIELRERLEAAIKTKDGGTLDTPENRHRVFEIELPVIEAMKLSGYFLIEADFIDYANKEKILVGYGRGSAVSYLSNYLLGITGINPMPYNLLPERFLSLDRGDPADVDSDFAIDGRYKVKAYAQRKYPNVSNIATVGLYKDKSAIKAAAKVFGANYSETQKLNSKITSIEEFETHADTQEYMKKFPHVIPLAKKLEGKIQNFGMHAGGIILSKEPIENHVPMQTAEDPSDKAAGRVPVAALDMRELADMGYIKYDLLGLRTLSIVDDCLKLIKERHGVEIDIHKIPLDDAEIYKMISQGRVAGLFQTDTGPGVKTIFDMGGINNFAELVASNALVRPGASNSTVGETYLNGKSTGIIKKVHPKIDHVLEETYGAVLYQEQQLLLCEYIAGMSKADANKVRKAISKKIPEDLAVWKDEFIAGATETVGVNKAKAIWKDLEASADYAFAKAHAVGYSMLTLLTAYLKHYYPIEFLVCNLNRMSGNKTDRMKTLKYLIEAKRLGIRVRLPHVNMSDANMSIQSDEQGDYIRMGLTQIKYVSGKNVGPLMRGVPYANYQAMVDAKLNKAVMNALNAVGAAAFDDNPRTGEEKNNFFNYLALPSFDTKDVPPTIFAQFRELREYSDDSVFFCMGLVGGEKSKPGWRLIDIVDETAVASAFCPPEANIEVGQVYIFLISNNRVVKWITTDDLINDSGGVMQRLLEAKSLPLDDNKALVVSFNSRRTKAGKQMADVVFADEDKNMISAMVWPSDFPQAYTKFKEGSIVRVEFSELDNGGFAVSKIL
jgi:DNA polymerase-3 subunit alpha